MEGTPRSRPRLTPELRERWRKRTDAAFERMFADKNQADLVTFTEREDMAVLIAKELAAFLLEEQLSQDPLVHPDENAPPCCPKCKLPGRPAMKPKEKLPDRQVTTRAGKVQLQRERWQCAKCRILFFSVRCSSPSGNGRLQSPADSNGDSAGK